ncbi:DMT family transporter [Arthrobacter sp. 18067]|uniref:DMT family transporter n=1 Tax=Arthrobacter sp. 18067 TaxID=2681413 RepID=UPI001F3E89AA|nr:DMT family transporter [Arthrobacter sp. 18067]
MAALRIFKSTAPLGLSRQEWALIAITALWGGTFVAIHYALEHSGPLFFVGLRFFLAGLISAAVFHRALRGIRWTEVGAGSAIGLTIFVGYGLQTVGLQTIQPSTSAFISALYVPLVPLMQWVIFKKVPRKSTLAGVLLAFAGLAFIAGPGLTSLGLGTGELVTVLSAFAMAAEIILIGLLAPRMNLQRLTIVQLLVAGILPFVVMPVANESIPAFSWSWLLPAIALGCASCLIQLTMSWAQRSVSPTRATIIYAGEPVWGGLFGRLAGDRLPPLALIGAALIILGTVVSEYRPRPSRPRQGIRKHSRDSTKRSMTP